MGERENKEDDTGIRSRAIWTQLQPPDTEFCYHFFIIFYKSQLQQNWTEILLLQINCLLNSSNAILSIKYVWMIDDETSNFFAKQNTMKRLLRPMYINL